MAQRHAIFTFVGDKRLEAMIPGRIGGIRAFVKAFGSHLHSIAFYVDGIDEIADALHEHGVRFYDSHGDQIDAAVPRHGQIPVTPGSRSRPDPGHARIPEDRVPLCDRVLMFSSFREPLRLASSGCSAGKRAGARRRGRSTRACSRR